MSLPVKTAAADGLAIEVADLRKTFHGGDFWAPKKWEAVRGVSFQVRTGEIYGLLGPNGAGKTTSVKLMVGLLRADGGTIRLFGGSPHERSVRARMAYIPEFPYFPRVLTAREVVRFHAGLFGWSSSVSEEKTRWALAETGLSGLEDRKIGEMSKGQKERVGWAQGILNDPELLFVDEPLSGLDPIAVIEMRELILKQRARGRTIFFNSHLLSEVERVANRVGILVQGQLAGEFVMDDALRQRGLERLFVDTVRSTTAAPLGGGQRG